MKFIRSKKRVKSFLEVETITKVSINFSTLFNDRFAGKITDKTVMAKTKSF